MMGLLGCVLGGRLGAERACVGQVRIGFQSGANLGRRCGGREDSNDEANGSLGKNR